MKQNFLKQLFQKNISNFDDKITIVLVWVVKKLNSENKVAA